MLYMRFMSDEEHKSLIMGHELVNNTVHSTHARTDSVGFCFVPVCMNAIRELEYVKEYLGGIVSDGMCVIFRDNGANLTEGYGVYADPDGWYDDIIVTSEYSTTTYDKYVMEPVYTIYRPFEFA